MTIDHGSDLSEEKHGLSSKRLHGYTDCATPLRGGGHLDIPLPFHELVLQDPFHAYVP